MFDSVNVKKILDNYILNKILQYRLKIDVLSFQVDMFVQSVIDV